jgi:hypothetical protein
MTRLELQSRMKLLREELENRHKTGTVKIADADGVPVSSETLQNELYKLNYKLSKFE